MRQKDSMPQPKQGFKMGNSIRYEDGLPQFGGEFFLHLVDSQTGEVLADLKGNQGRVRE